jgi:hypothetical protein
MSDALRYAALFFLPISDFSVSIMVDDYMQPKGTEDIRYMTALTRKSWSSGQTFIWRL